MAIIAALLPNPADREYLTAAVPPHQVLWAESWRELLRLVRRQPTGVVVIDLHAERRKDGALRVFRFSQRYPLTPLIAWGDVVVSRAARPALVDGARAQRGIGGASVGLFLGRGVSAGHQGDDRRARESDADY